MMKQRYLFPKRYVVLASILAGIFILGACGQKEAELAKTPQPITPPPVVVHVAPPSTPVPPPEPAPTPFSFVWISDTQMYAKQNPEVLANVAQWMADNAAAENFIAALHVGDVVDERGKAEQWENIVPALTRIRQAMPLYVVAGNHDVTQPGFDYSDYLSHVFCDAKNPDLQYEGGQCFAQPLEAGGRKLLLLGIGWQGEESTHFPWVEEMMERYADHSVIILIHSFLRADGTPTAGGERLEALFAAYDNLRLVLCGHMHGEAKWEKSYAAGHTVHVLMFNLQEQHRKGEGLGYLRILTIDPVTGTLCVTTYSPFLDDYNYYEESVDSFALEGLFL